MTPSTRHTPRAELLPPADGAARLVSLLQNPVFTGVYTSNLPVAGVVTAQAAIDFIVNEVSLSAAARRSSHPSAANPL
jgi:hypothetical protein